LIEEKERRDLFLGTKKKMVLCPRTEITKHRRRHAVAGKKKNSEKAEPCELLATRMRERSTYQMEGGETEGGQEEGAEFAAADLLS